MLAAPTFFLPIKFGSQSRGDFIDTGVGCSNPTKVLIKEAKSYYRMKSYKAPQPICLVSIGTGHKDLIPSHRAASTFWFKDRSGLSVAPILGEIFTDCENTHNEVLLSYLENNMRDQYFRLNVPHSMQQMTLDEWAERDDIKTYTDKYLRLNQTEQELSDCVKQLLPSSQIIIETEGSRNQNEREQLSLQRLQILQGGSNFQGSNLVHGGSQFQGTLLARKRLFPSTVRTRTVL